MLLLVSRRMGIYTKGKKPTANHLSRIIFLLRLNYILLLLLLLFFIFIYFFDTRTRSGSLVSTQRKYIRQFAIDRRLTLLSSNRIGRSVNTD